MTPDDLAALARLQAERKEVGFEPDFSSNEAVLAQLKQTRRCMFGHSVPWGHGYQVQAGFVCFAHASEFDKDAARS